MVARIHLSLIIFILLFSNSGCSQEIPEVSPVQVKQILDEKEDVIIIDVRTSGEFTGELGHIPGAILRPLQEIEDWQTEFSEENDNRIIMVCRSGNRSGVTTRYFLDHGYLNVQNMSGGMRAWNELSFPIEKSPAEE
ncbi:MAG: rhodanese-like domain-containing protein [Calditrichia bacterium]|nr:rhodanese-like domain-containing protein [Calditrichia bacterium]